MDRIIDVNQPENRGAKGQSESPNPADQITAARILVPWELLQPTPKTSIFWKSWNYLSVVNRAPVIGMAEPMSRGQRV